MLLVLNQTTPRPPSDQVAKRYCFKASCQLIRKTTPRIIATYTCYDKSPDVAKLVEHVCHEHSMLDDDGAECTPVELVAFADCPVECDGDVTCVVNIE